MLNYVYLVMRRLLILLLALFLAAGLIIHKASKARAQFPGVTGTPAQTATYVPDTATPFPTASPVPNPATILWPVPGQALQGRLIISGTVYVSDFRQAELSFGYEGDPTKTWFLVTDIPQPVLSGKLAEWDTTTLTDGNYTLRLALTRQDGNRLTYLVAGLRVRNYSPIETSTPAPSQLATQAARPGVTPKAPTATSTPIPSATHELPTSTPLPPNPAQLTSAALRQGLLKGAAGAAALFVLLLLYMAARSRK